MINFGTGKLIAIPTHDSLGASIAVPTPVRLATMQDISVDMDIDLKLLYGGQRYPIAVGQGKGKIEIKAKYAEIDGAILGSLLFGKTPTAGIKAAVFDFAAAVPATPGPYTIAVAPPNSGTWITDMGVVNASTGDQMTRVSSAPAAGQYSVSAGTYTFAAANQGLAVLISYEYSATSTTAKTFNLTNDTMGPTSAFTTLLQNTYDGKNLVMKLNRAVSAKLSLPFKNDDFAIYDFNAQAFADAAGNIGYICLF